MSDLIDRQAAIDAVCMEWCGVKHQDCKHPFDMEKDDYFWCDGCETALRTLPELPSAEPEPMCVAKVTLTDEQVKEAFEKAKCEILTVLDAQPERKRGKWIERWHDNQHVIGDMACSVCGAQMLLTFPRFCPCCGAYMREEEQDE